MRLLDKSKVDTIVIHCTGTVRGRDYSVKTIRGWHLKKGFEDIGYHFVIDSLGGIMTGRDIKYIGAHAEGVNNRSIGVAYVGGLNEQGFYCNTLNVYQENALINLLQKIKKEYHIKHIIGHNQIANKACPCFSVPMFLRRNYLRTDGSRIESKQNVSVVSSKNGML